MNELGIRLGTKAHDRVTLRTAVFAADWNHVQADLIDPSGLPYTSNIGRGRILGIDGEVSWRLSPVLTFDASAFVIDSSLSSPVLGLGASDRQSLPNVASEGGRIATHWRKDIAPGIAFDGEIAVRYVGKSRLGVGPQLDIRQGGYATTSMAGRIAFGRFAPSLTIDNLADVHANTFAFGNPFTVAQRDQMTPLRPRTLRIGIDATF